MYERTFFLLLIDSFNRKDGDLLKRNGKCEKLLYEYISVHAKDILEGHDTSNDSMYKNEYKRYIEYLDQTIEPTKEELKIMAETAEYILPKQDSIFNPSEPFTFTEKDLGFIAKRNYNNDINNQNKYHRELINLIINAMLSKYINMDTP